MSEEEAKNITDGPAGFAAPPGMQTVYVKTTDSMDNGTDIWRAVFEPVGIDCIALAPAPAPSLSLPAEAPQPMGSVGTGSPGPEWDTGGIATGSPIAPTGSSDVASRSSHKKLSKGAIAGIVVGGIAFLFLLGLACFCICRKI